MDTTLDIEFAQKSESIVAQFGFKDLKSFVKNQALLMLMAKIEGLKNEEVCAITSLRKMAFVFPKITATPSGSWLKQEHSRASSPNN